MKETVIALKALYAANNQAAVVSPATPAGKLYGYSGLHWVNAPEKTGTTKTGYPRVVVTQLDNPNDDIHAFGNGVYIENTRYQFKIYDNSLDGAAAVIDNLIAVYDSRVNIAALFTNDILN